MSLHTKRLVMRTLSFTSTDEALNHLDSSREIENGKQDLSAHRFQQNEASFVRLEIQAGALRRLIAKHKLMIDEVHCLDRQSKNIIRHALLDSLGRY